MRPRENEEYPDCNRCGIRIPARTEDGRCGDCRIVDTPRWPPHAQRNYPELTHTITIHAPGSYQAWQYHPTMVTIRELQIRHTWVDVEADWVAHHYTTDGLGHHTWPVITVTDGPDLTDHWAGHNPVKLTQWAPQHQEQEQAA
jgi:hypothetical protein